MQRNYPLIFERYLEKIEYKCISIMNSHQFT